MPTVSMTCVPETAEVIMGVVIDEELEAVLFEDEAERVFCDNFSA